MFSKQNSHFIALGLNIQMIEMVEMYVLSLIIYWIIICLEQSLLPEQRLLHPSRWESSNHTLPLVGCLASRERWEWSSHIYM